MENNDEKLVVVEVNEDNEFKLTNTCTGIQATVSPMALHENGFKYFSEFCHFFSKSVQADKDAAVLFTNEATTNLNVILEFNRMVL